MQMMIDIPEEAYQELEKEAELSHTTTANLAATRLLATISGSRVPHERNVRISVPLIRSREPGSFDPGEGGIYDYIEFP